MSTEPCARGVCAAEAGHEGACADASGWGTAEIEAAIEAFRHRSTELRLEAAEAQLAAIRYLMGELRSAPPPPSGASLAAKYAAWERRAIGKQLFVALEGDENVDRKLFDAETCDKLRENLQASLTVP
ncbi:hypothetical protein [Rhodococcus opacus]|uniref:hypothetical protein n=1 Tax=Rhodococcus opacus TaxID=37919 RepID=UPI001C47F7C8|nr:hypothetical protein [Rhodococcus opacus]MBV6758393.1 hypothetical protein [Rhodococcus opacus]